ncbi:MAG: hypothetical protein E6J90_49035 [Deltaproteobacteria bacterium]|nr:MAG: hypothetical protein E6J91_47165 [Deltaproteobacteria bacterium]TMQ05422.1 MAG: hypothetical protein E6J90_49035 [Deltaproteobacteria bacterium]
MLAGTARGAGRVTEVPLLEIAGGLEAARVLLVGELHGTVECPAVFGDLVFAAAQRGPVSVGLDLPASEQAELDHFLVDPDDDARRARWLARPLFTTRHQDGHTSRAMQGLLDRLGRYRRKGTPIEVFAFDAPAHGERADEDRDLRMARAIAEHARDRTRRVLALMGNVHNQLDRDTPWAPDFPTVAMHLRDILGEDDLRSLTLDWVTGTAWTETDQGVGEQICDGFQLAPVGSVVIEREHESAAWRHAIINLGTLHASPPAVAPAREGA